MKYFMVNEEELKDLVSGYYTFSGQPVYKWVNDFLKSKTPVEEMAAFGVEKNGWGQFIFTKSDETILGYTNGYPNILTEEQKDLFNNLKGKNIKIYIEVIK